MFMSSRSAKKSNMARSYRSKKKTTVVIKSSTKSTVVRVPAPQVDGLNSVARFVADNLTSDRMTRLLDRACAW